MNKQNLKNSLMHGKPVTAVTRTAGTWSIYRHFLCPVRRAVGFLGFEETFSS